MGPRLGSRGSRMSTIAQRISPGLQWGRGSEAAEAPFLPTCSGMVGKLQWGRGSEAAEALSSARLVRLPYRLQWGRGSEAAEAPKRQASHI